MIDGASERANERPSERETCERRTTIVVEAPDMCSVESQDIRLAETQDMCCAESSDMCSIQSQYKGNHKGGRAAPFVVAAEGRPFVLALKRAHVSERASDRASERSSERVIDGASERPSERASERPNERATGERRTTIIVETQETMCLPEKQCILQKDNVSSKETICFPEKQCVFTDRVFRAC